MGADQGWKDDSNVALFDARRLFLSAEDLGGRRRAIAEVLRRLEHLFTGLLGDPPMTVQCQGGGGGGDTCSFCYISDRGSHTDTPVSVKDVVSDGTFTKLSCVERFKGFHRLLRFEIPQLEIPQRARKSLVVSERSFGEKRWLRPAGGVGALSWSS